MTQLKKYDFSSGDTKTWRDPRKEFEIYGEPVFVAAPDAQAEDDGVILAPMMAHEPGQRSALVVLNAKTFSEVARAYSPSDVKVPFSFHGEFDPAKL